MQAIIANIMPKPSFLNWIIRFFIKVMDVQKTLKSLLKFP